MLFNQRSVKFGKCVLPSGRINQQVSSLNKMKELNSTPPFQQDKLLVPSCMGEVIIRLRLSTTDRSETTFNQLTKLYVKLFN
ncbi:MAG: hypothetical protein ACTS5F_00445 [Candidatus Hodgkinia cicadicola]